MLSFYELDKRFKGRLNQPYPSPGYGLGNNYSKKLRYIPFPNYPISLSCYL